MSACAITTVWPRAVAVVLAASLATACTGYKPVTLPAPPPASSQMSLDVKVGDLVRVALADRQQREFRVKAIEPDALVGEDGRRVPYADIVMLERRAVNKVRTTLLVLSPAIAVLGTLVVVIVGCAIKNCR